MTGDWWFKSTRQDHKLLILLHFCKIIIKNKVWNPPWQKWFPFRKDLEIKPFPFNRIVNAIGLDTQSYVVFWLNSSVKYFVLPVITVTLRRFLFMGRCLEMVTALTANQVYVGSSPILPSNYSPMVKMVIIMLW